MNNLIGQDLGQYRIVTSIGKGGMAAVYKAYQPSMDRYVAVKVLPSHFMQDPTFVERFEREAHTVARLEHPHILPVHDYGKTQDGTTYIVMRYVEGGTLADLLEESVLFLEESFRIFTQISQALAYAHAQGVIHRDLKPSNVLIDLQDQAFLTDFGLARMLEGDSELTGNMVVGTPTYMAPEQGEGRPADTRSDIYSLGVILYEMVTGRRPFQAETPMAVMIKHLTEPLPPPRAINPALSPAVEQIIVKALVKASGERYQTVTDLIRDLQAAIREPVTSGTLTRPIAPTPIMSPQPPLSPAPPTISVKSAQISPWLLLILGILILIVLLFIGLSFLNGIG